MNENAKKVYEIIKNHLPILQMKTHHTYIP